MEEADKALLRELGLTEEDFDRFDGTSVRYECDEKMGVRIYDPYYRTSYREYIGIDGWSAWSSERDTFMSDILRKTHADLQQAAGDRQARDPDRFTDALQKKFGTKEDPGRE